MTVSEGSSNSGAEFVPVGHDYKKRSRKAKFLKPKQATGDLKKPPVKR